MLQIARSLLQRHGNSSVTLLLLARLPGTDAADGNATAWTNWANTTAARFNLTAVGVQAFLLPVPRPDNVFVVTDIAPWNNGARASLLGADVSVFASTGAVEVALGRLQAAAVPNSVWGQLAVSSPMVTLTALATGTGFVSFCTVRDADPCEYVLALQAALDAVTSPLLALSPDAVVTVTDTAGGVFVDGGSGCKPADAVAAVSMPLHFTPSQSWLLTVGQCPHYTAAYLASSTKLTLAATWLGVIVGIAVVVLVVVAVTATVRSKFLSGPLSGSAALVPAHGITAQWWITGFGAFSPPLSATIACLCFVDGQERVCGAVPSRLSGHTRFPPLDVFAK